MTVMLWKERFEADAIARKQDEYASRLRAILDLPLQEFRLSAIKLWLDYKAERLLKGPYSLAALQSRKSVRRVIPAVIRDTRRRTRVEFT